MKKAKRKKVRKAIPRPTPPPTLLIPPIDRDALRLIVGATRDQKAIAELERLIAHCEVLQIVLTSALGPAIQSMRDEFQAQYRDLAWRLKIHGEYLDGMREVWRDSLRPKRKRRKKRARK
jgi:hypothetical protein